MKNLTRLGAIILITALVLLSGTLPSMALSQADVSRPNMAFAQLSGGYIYVKDEANLLSDSEEYQLEQKLEEIRERLEFDVVVVTVDSTGMTSVTDYADRYFEDNGYGYGPNRDGILLLISYDEGQWATSTSGYGITALTDYGLTQIEDELVGYLNQGRFYDAFDKFADRCDEYVTSAKDGNIIDVGNQPKGPFPWASRGILAVVVGAIGGFIGTGSARSQLKTVYSQASAGNYVVNDSLALDQRGSRDLFLFRNITRVPIQQSRPGEMSGGSTTHMSSGGMTHGGHSGTFKH